uniref:Uncharacterized protein n=1 Tax=Ascaris lumbricoides TaxID=6252 RepID=A0A0M3HX99_ASCLU
MEREGVQKRLKVHRQNGPPQQRRSNVFKNSIDICDRVVNDAVLSTLCRRRITVNGNSSASIRKIGDEKEFGIARQGTTYNQHAMQQAMHSRLVANCFFAHFEVPNSVVCEQPFHVICSFTAPVAASLALRALSNPFLVCLAFILPEVYLLSFGSASRRGSC